MSSQWRLDGGHAGGAPAGPGQSPHLTELRVLIVDGSHDAADSLALLVRLWGYAVRVAYSAAEALQALDGFAPAVVISEMVLPRQNGCELARLIRQRDREVLLVALTGQGRDADRARCREAGFDLHFTKPADPLDVQKVLRQKAAAAGPCAEDQPIICAGR